MFGRKKNKEEVKVNVDLVEGLPLHENTTLNLTLNAQSLVITDHSKMNSLYRSIRSRL